MRKLLLILTFIMICTITAFADDTETLLVGEEVPIVIPAGAVCESENDKIATVKKDMLIGVSPGETDIKIKEKMLFFNKTVDNIHVVVGEEAVLSIKPEEEIAFSPEFSLFDSSKKKLKDFTINENINLQPGTYYIKEKTWYSSLFEDYTKIELKKGERSNISTFFQEPAKVKFKALDKDICGEKITLWKKHGKDYAKYTTLKINDDQETEEIIARSGDYFWEYEGNTIKPPVFDPVKYEKHNLYPFSVSGNPVTISLSSSTASVASEQVVFNENANANAKKIYQILTEEYNCPPIPACAIIGNMYGESGIRTYALEKGGGGGHGLCQWTGGRWNNLNSYAKSQGKDWTEIDVQIAFLMKELSDMNMNEFWYAESVDEATEIFMRKFERPASWVYATSLPKRIGAAKNALQAFASEKN